MEQRAPLCLMQQADALHDVRDGATLVGEKVACGVLQCQRQVEHMALVVRLEVQQPLHQTQTLR